MFMKKIVFIFLMFVFTNVTYAFVDGMTVELESPTVGTNDTTYVSVFLLDENQKQISDANPTIKATPSFPVELWTFISCSSAEGRDVCGKMDNELVGLWGAYVVQIKTKEIDENVMLTVYSDDTDDAKVYTRELVIWEGKAVEEVQTLSEVPEVGGNNIKGTYLLYLLWFMLLAFGVTLFSFKAQKQKSK